MNEDAVLELTLTQRNENRYFLTFRFSTPDNISGTNLGAGAGLEVVFDPSRLATAADALSYGQRLSEQIFAAEAARTAFNTARSICLAKGLPFRVRLAIIPGQSGLHGLRWETLTDPIDNSLLCTNANVLFSRYISADTARKFVRPELDELRAVVVVANPAKLDEDYGLAAVSVQDEIDRARAGLGERISVLLDSGGKATLERIIAAIQSGCELVYLVAHGKFGKGSPILYLEKEDGSVFACPAEMLISRLTELDRLPLLFLLVSCQSAGTGDGATETAQVALGPRLAAAGVPAVIAMQGNVSYQTMAHFLPEFFDRLMEDARVDRATAMARAKANGQNRPDWWMPVLFSNLDDNRLFNPPTPWTTLSYEPDTVPVRAGKFMMGGDGAWQSPCHEVTLPTYRIGRYPVTNRQYMEFVRDTREVVNPEVGWDGQTPPVGRLDHPVSGVTWYQALAYCRWLSGKTGKSYTLPTEAQWEKAARGDQGWVYPWGNEWQPGRANDIPETITAVNQYPAQTPYGCFDMVGNVREWTLSLWGDKRSEPNPEFRYPWVETDGRNDPTANEQIRRIFRGGAGGTPAEMMCSARDSFLPSKPGPAGKRHGFRVVINS